MAIKIFTLDEITIADSNIAQRLSASTIYVASVTIQADYNNGGRISVGGENVDNTNGIQIEKGESAVIEFPANHAGFTDEFDLKEIWVVSTSTNDKVRVSYIKRA
jgi:hypothetical protein